MIMHQRVQKKHWNIEAQWLKANIMQNAEIIARGRQGLLDVFHMDKSQIPSNCLTERNNNLLTFPSI